MPSAVAHTSAGKQSSAPVTFAEDSHPERDVNATRFRPCVVIPTYNNPDTIETVVRNVREHLTDIIVVDDGGSSHARETCARLQNTGLATVIHRERNGGKGAAVKTGTAAAERLGFTHALQIDGDGQHDTSVLPRFLQLSCDNPQALVIAYPEYDESVPKHRLLARKITTFWVNLEVGDKDTIRDAMVGLRVYPLQRLHELHVRGQRMDFDIEVAVKFAWSGAPIINAPVAVRYLAEEEGGVSHFQPFLDNLRFSLMHARLCTQKMFRYLLHSTRRLR